MLKPAKKSSRWPRIGRSSDRQRANKRRTRRKLMRSSAPPRPRAWSAALDSAAADTGPLSAGGGATREPSPGPARVLYSWHGAWGNRPVRGDTARVEPRRQARSYSQEGGGGVRNGCPDPTLVAVGVS